MRGVGGFPPPSGNAVIGDVANGKTFSSLAAGMGKTGTKALVTGNAVAADVKNGKTFSSTAGDNIAGNSTTKAWASGTANTSGSPLTITGLAFTPSLVFGYSTAPASGGTLSSFFSANSAGNIARGSSGFQGAFGGDNTSPSSFFNSFTPTFGAGTFTISMYGNAGAIQWFAFE